MRFLLALLVAMAASQAAHPQEPMPTLRVFANLIQIPTLVLDDRGRPVEEKTNPQFTVRLDGGKPFAPTHVRLEGDDPISLTVLLDASGEEAELVNEMNFELASLARAGSQDANSGREGLWPRDRVTIYALDCVLMRSLKDVPADRIALKVGVEQALRDPRLHEGKNKGACASGLALRDTLLALAHELAQLPGRRVLLVVSSGRDRGSVESWLKVRDVMQSSGVTMFGLALEGGAVGAASPQLNSSFAPAEYTQSHDRNFDTVCQTSGGLVLTAREATLNGRLLQLTRLLRARYIIQFPRSDQMAAGHHQMMVEVPYKHYFVRSSGASVPIADPKLKDDPTVLRVQPEGSRPPPPPSYFR